MEAGQKGRLELFGGLTTEGGESTLSTWTHCQRETATRDQLREETSRSGFLQAHSVTGPAELPSTRELRYREASSFILWRLTTIFQTFRLNTHIGFISRM